MSAETLRRAAALMRERAEAATPGQWTVSRYGIGADVMWEIDTAEENLGAMNDPGDAEHIASWHPAVALAVAGWLSMSADHASGGGAVCESCVDQALAVARAFLGGSA